MDCRQAQNDLLSAESLTLLGPELSAHIAECPVCQTLLARLRNLETQTQALPVPPGHEQPSPEFLRRDVAIAAKSGPKVRHFVRRAIAAAIVLAFGLAAISLIFFNGSTVQADVLLEQLVNWNLAIAHTHDTAARKSVYQQQLNQLQKQVDQSHLASADRELARALLNNAQWMTTEQNAADESLHFQALANQLHARQQAASDGVANHLQKIYQQLINEGVSQGTGAHVSPASPQNGHQPQTGPSSVLPQNHGTASASAKLNMALTMEPSVASSNIAMESSGRTAFFAAGAGGGSAAVNPSRSFSPGEGGSIRPGAGRLHHAGTRASSGESSGAAGEISHGSPAPAPATVVSTPLSPHNENDSPTHSGSTALSPATSPPGVDAATPTSSKTAPHNPGFAGSGRHSSLTDAAGLEPPAHWRLAPPFDSDDLVAADQTSETFPMPPMPTDTSLSRLEIEAMLAHHIDGERFESSDWILLYPPPIGEEGRRFFDMDDANPPIPFPEPSLGLAVLLVGFGLRIRKKNTESF